MVKDRIGHLLSKKLENEGWVELEDISCPESLLAVAEKIGTIIPHPNGKLLNVLKPSDGVASMSGTFSSIYGFEAFPLHTDTAFWPKPVRYIVMGVLNEDQTSTYIESTISIINTLTRFARNAAKTAVYKVITPSGVHFTSLMFNEHGMQGFRFDPCCMTPANESAKIFDSEFREAATTIKPYKISWSGSKALILDNWNTMHGRSAIKDISRNRELLRIYVE